METIEGEINYFRAKINRNLLEKMMNGSDETMESAKDFFARVSSQSGAVISFPQIWKLQIMPKSEPEIRIMGSSSQVRSARKLIMDVLDQNINRVVLKMDVSFADHSFIIGKGGKRIQSIMDTTQTLIHFPDENLLTNEMKSNTVTITCDSLRQVDEARQMIRQSLPLTIGFQVIVKAEKLFLVDISHPFIEYYQKRYNVIVSFKSIQIQSPGFESFVATVEVRGNRLQMNQLEETVHALDSLLDSSEFGINSKVVTINLEITPRNYSFVMGLNKSNIKAICSRTAAIILFPDTQNKMSSLHTKNESCVTIKGVGIQSAYMAWLQLLELLPVVIFCDVKAEQINFERIPILMANPLLSIKVSPKTNSDKTTLILKTEERNINLLFEARKLILNIIEEPKIVCLNGWKLLSNWHQRYGRLTALPIESDATDSEPEVLRSVRI